MVETAKGQPGAERMLAQVSFEETSDRQGPLRTTRLTSEGWIWLVVMLGFMTLGLFKGINLLTLVASFLLAALVFNLYLAGRKLNLLQVRRLVDEPAFARTPFSLKVEVVHPGSKPHFGLGVEDAGPHHNNVWFLTQLRGGESRWFHHQVVVPARGMYRCRPLTIRSGYPFGLAVRSFRWQPGEQILVFPQLGKLHRGLLRQFLTHTAPAQEKVLRRPCRHPTPRANFTACAPFAWETVRA